MIQTFKYFHWQFTSWFTPHWKKCDTSKKLLKFAWSLYFIPLFIVNSHSTPDQDYSRIWYYTQMKPTIAFNNPEKNLKLWTACVSQRPNKSYPQNKISYKENRAVWHLSHYGTLTQGTHFFSNLKFQGIGRTFRCIS